MIQEPQLSVKQACTEYASNLKDKDASVDAQITNYSSDGETKIHFPVHITVHGFAK